MRKRPERQRASLVLSALGWILTGAYLSFLVFSEAWQGWLGALLKLSRVSVDQQIAEGALLALLVLLSATFTAADQVSKRRRDLTLKEWGGLFFSLLPPLAVTGLSPVILIPLVGDKTISGLVGGLLAALSFLLSLLVGGLLTKMQLAPGQPQQIPTPELVPSQIVVRDVERKAGPGPVVVAIATTAFVIISAQQLSRMVR